PLMLAAFHGHTRAITTLQEYGAQNNTEDDVYNKYTYKEYGLRGAARRAQTEEDCIDIKTRWIDQEGASTNILADEYLLVKACQNNNLSLAQGIMSINIKDEN